MHHWQDSLSSSELCENIQSTRRKHIKFVFSSFGLFLLIALNIYIFSRLLSYAALSHTITQCGVNATGYENFTSYYLETVNRPETLVWNKITYMNEEIQNKTTGGPSGFLSRKLLQPENLSPNYENKTFKFPKGCLFACGGV